MKENENKRPRSDTTDWQSASEWFSQRQNERINTSKGKYDPAAEQKRRQEEMQRQQRQARYNESLRTQNEKSNINSQAGERASAPRKSKKESPSTAGYTKKNKAQAKSKDELRREYAQKTRKRRKRRILEWFVFTALIFVAIFIAASLTVLFHIEEINVEGDTRYSAQQIIEASCIESGDNLWRTHTRDVSQRVSTALPYVGKVSISRKIPSTIVLEVEETVPVYAVKRNKRYILIDKYDKVLEINSKSSNKVLVIEGVDSDSAEEGKKFTPDLSENYQTAKDIYRYADENGISITKINIADVNDISAVCEKVIRLDFGSATQLGEKMIMANEVISKLKEEGSLNEGVINLKSTTKAFYKDGPIETTADTSQAVTDENTSQASAQDGSSESSEPETSPTAADANTAASDVTDGSTASSSQSD